MRGCTVWSHVVLVECGRSRPALLTFSPSASPLPSSANRLADSSPAQQNI
jgi:hypothetical protein